jgi:cellulose synthase/poly-beta-1,6-N-acetylglucosamine synthase-like glycosyltransferase
MISILMPIYNGIEFITDSVISVSEQTYTKWELIIAVNGHPPNSEVFNLAKQYEIVGDNVRVLDLYNCKGKANTLNEMLKYCKYDWVSLLDVDDMWLPEKLEKQIPHMEKYDVIGTQCRYFGDLNTSPNIPLGDITGFDFRKVNPIINSSCLVRKNICFWEENGVEDYDMWLRLWTQKKRFFNVEEILVKHRIHQSSAFNAKGNQHKVSDILQKYN